MTDNEPIKVTSHVSRDFIQNSAYFNTLPKIIWEYVSNSLDAGDDDAITSVDVQIKSNKVTIVDNGRGMSRDELRNFFQMHGENIQRKRGKRVRGRFGTGKSAAFGLANSLMIDSLQNDLRNCIKLTRSDIEAAKSGDSFPVQEIIINQKDSRGNGTRVEIDDFNQPKIINQVDKVIAYIEKHLSRYRQRARVMINGHECKFVEPIFTRSYALKAPKIVADRLGDIDLTIKISPIPLDEDTQGIDILSYGIWHETTLAGLEKKERANYLFGEVDVPILEDENWAIPPFDNTRNNSLNHQNPAVATLLGWLSTELDIVRQELVDEERRRKKTEESKQLAKAAELIAKILNEDFSKVELELELSKRISGRAGQRYIDELLDEHGELMPGDGNEATPWEQTGPEHGDGKRGEVASEGDEPRPGPDIQPGNEAGAKKTDAEGTRKRRRSMFSIDFESASVDSPRSRYDNESKTIYINLDHPQIANAYEMGDRNIKSKQFQEMCYEVACVEYAIAIPFERIDRDEFYDASDALFDVKDTINRISKRFAALMS